MALFFLLFVEAHIPQIHIVQNLCCSRAAIIIIRLEAAWRYRAETVLLGNSKSQPTELTQKKTLRFHADDVGPIFAKTRAPTNCWFERTLPFVRERLVFL